MKIDTKLELGQTVYIIKNGTIVEAKIKSFVIDGDGMSVIALDEKRQLMMSINEQKFGKTLFSTRDKAERSIE